VFYGWAAVFLWSLFWCAVMPSFFRRNGFHLPVETFPDGTMVMAALVFGWFYPLIIVGIRMYLENRKKKSGPAV
jgi:hypothetical protein